MSDTSLGKFTVRVGLRTDNPLFPVYLVFLGAKLIGKQFSVPTISDCEWLERQHDPVIRPVYAAPSARGRTFSTGGYYTRNATKKVA